MFNVIVKLRSGEIKAMKNIRNVSWTRSRVIFTDIEEKSYTYVGGSIVSCSIEEVRDK